RRSGAIPLIATTVDGRPIKLEGNPLHPASGGATDTFVQASILDLYDPSRSQRFVHNGKASDRAGFDAYIEMLRSGLPGQRGDSMNRLYVVENRFTLTGAMADHRLRCPASQIAVFAHALAGKILAATNDAGLGAMVGTLHGTGSATTFNEQWLGEAANDLLTKPGASLVLTGPNQP